jgi:hypothetical protein
MPRLEWCTKEDSMTRRLSGMCAVAVLAGLVGLSAASLRERDAAAQQAPRPSVVAVSGCLDRAEPDGPVPGVQFVLKNATGGSSSTYGLLPGPGVDLAPHVNHQVRVTGVLASPPDGRSAGPPTLTVQSLKLLASNCG